ncbi:VOC family protein [Micromonospora sp. LOL_021]|uniref:VOC family protein n=1 Tax=Micromonospora sp. LOL_021 TaxID=3345417 RepID=UPI003A844D88
MTTFRFRAGLASLLAVGILAGGSAAPSVAAPVPTEQTATSTIQAEVRYGQPNIYTWDIARMIAFYRDNLGFTEVYRFPETGTAVFGTVVKGDFYLTFVTYEQIRSSTGINRIFPGYLRQFDITVLVQTPAEVDAMVTAMAATGVQVLMAPTDQPWGERQAYVTDPEGNLVQISTHSA